MNGVTAARSATAMMATAPITPLRGNVIASVRRATAALRFLSLKNILKKRIYIIPAVRHEILEMHKVVFSFLIGLCLLKASFAAGKFCLIGIFVSFR